MDASSLTAARSRELADLRRRAYGPNADIDSDPAAQRRLHELEELVRPSISEASSPPDRQIDGDRRRSSPDGAAAGERTRTPSSVALYPPSEAPDEDAVEVPRPAVTAPARRWWQRVPLWAVTAVAGIAVGLAAGLAWPTDSEPPPDLTLDVEPGGGERGAGFTENLDYWGVDPGSVVPHEQFDVIQVWTARAVDESRCVLLSHDGGFLSATCSGGGLDPVLDFTVYDGMSLEFDEPLPIGTVIRFVGRSGHVDVWVSAPGDPQAGDASASIWPAASAPNRA
ncbi:hypothetical protein MK786_00755 [Microbacterium sp. CFH 31415]|uniref:hypothetical protein n=1 Tax=Microbacterium sp. CFH 31415 TaxID=2921732 RepID=UPI001F12AF83|nr:hypothetical protein [Microbacterium sp. CFH 31415]MCH6229268.1 hypothetical protein [Microbacterium sp. CFH 31415]